MKPLAILAAALVAFSAFAADVDAVFAQTPGATTILAGGTNKLVAFSTNGPYTISCSESTEVFLFVNFKYLNAVGSGDTNGIHFDFYRGIDGSTFESNTWFVASFQANATTTTANSTETNLTVAGIPALRFYVVNGSTNAHATNLTVMVRPKIPAAKLR